MAEDAFDENVLTEKLSKLNNSQQSIESFSKWCIAHRKKAKIVVERWDALFKSASQEKRISLLYSANDILQNSRRKGSDFVNEFWKVLPPVLKRVHNSSDEDCKRVASRLVDIWEERKVFGSKGLNLRNELLGADAAPRKHSSSAKDPAIGKNHSPAEDVVFVNPIKVVKRDSNFVRIKLAVGSLPEKILTAFQQLHDQIVNEESALNECKKAVSSVRDFEKDAANAIAQGSQTVPQVMENLPKLENVLGQSVAQLEKIEKARVTFCTQLREAVQDQETKLGLIQSELHVARGQIEQTGTTRLHITKPLTVTQVPTMASYPPPLMTNTLNPTIHPSTTLMKPSLTDEESKRAAAAAVAAKLAASASSAQMLTSVLSSLVAEEAASLNSGLKRPRQENPALVPDAKNIEGENSSAHFPSMLQGSAPLPPPPPPPMQPPMSQLQPPFLSSPQLSLPPNFPTNQIAQSAVMNLAYGYGRGNLQPPMPSDFPVGFTRPGLPLQHAQLPSSQQQQQVPPGGEFRPLGVGFHGQSHQPATPPIHRQ